MRTVGNDLLGAEPRGPDDAVLRRVLSAFGLPGDVMAVKQLDRAWSNRVWSVRTTGERYAVKEMLNPWNDPHWREWLCAAIAFEELAVEAGVHAPPPFRAASGAALVDVEDRTFRAHRWVDAEVCPAGPVSTDVARAVARDLATMHTLQVVPGRTDVFPTLSTATCDAWPELVADLHRAGSPYASPADRVAPDVAAVGAWFTRRPPVEGMLVMSHGDVDQKNLLIGRGTPWLVDWDVAAPWLPGEEALRTAMTLADWRDAALARMFLTSYADAGGTPVAPAAESLSIDLVIGIDWLDRCLRIEAGLQDADARRVTEARAHVPHQLREIHDRVAIATDLPRWLSDRSGAEDLR